MIILYYGSTGGITACVSSTESRAGTYQPNTGQTSCITATSGNYGSSSGATSQSQWPANSYCRNGKKAACTSLGPKYTKSAAGASSNTACYMTVAAGKYKSSAIGISVTDCAAGKYSIEHKSYYSSTDSTSCITCAQGSYSSSSGSSACTACTGGKTNTA